MTESRQKPLKDIRYSTSANELARIVGPAQKTGRPPTAAEEYIALHPNSQDADKGIKIEQDPRAKALIAAYKKEEAARKAKQPTPEQKAADKRDRKNARRRAREKERKAQST